MLTLSALTYDPMDEDSPPRQELLETVKESLDILNAALDLLQKNNVQVEIVPTAKFPVDRERWYIQLYLADPIQL